LWADHPTTHRITTHEPQPTGKIIAGARKQSTTVRKTMAQCRPVESGSVELGVVIISIKIQLKLYAKTNNGVNCGAAAGAPIKVN